MNPHTLEITKLVVHHSASDPRNTSLQDIHKWHVEENKWDSIGYHFVITSYGILEYTRPVHMQGAHTKGHNNGSIAVCVIGNNTIPDQSWDRFQVGALIDLYRAVNKVFKNIEVYGHRDLANTTECPGLDVRPMLLGPREVKDGRA